MLSTRQKILLSIFLYAGFAAQSVFAVPTPTAQSAPDNTSFTIIAGAYRENVPPETVAAWYTVAPRLVYDQTYTAEAENTAVCPLVFEPCAFLMTARNAVHIAAQETPVLSRAHILAYTQELAERIGSVPHNVELDVIDDTIVVTKKDKSGIGIDPTESADKIMTALNRNDRSVELDSSPRQATVRADNYKDLGIIELIGEGRSDFSGSTTTRIHNIKTAAARFDDIFIAPDEEFSFVEHLGPVDGEHGFAKELVIIDNQTRPEYGGGICQVSTTVFRSAVLTGMKITQRRNHSYPVHYYYPTGFDATVYIPSPDMRFVNNTGKYVMLDMGMEGHELVFRFYGTKDGRDVVMKGPVVTQRNPDGSMKTYFTQTVTDATGKTLIDDTFRSNYKSPKDFPRPGQEVSLTTKPKDWSKKQWVAYKKEHNL